jgi:L-ribulose-5-phosphate 4-epimerase
VSSNLTGNAVDAVPGSDVDFTPALQVTIARVREEVAALHAELLHQGLAAWTEGDVSARVPGADLFVIRPVDLESGDLAPENMILCDLDGGVIPNTPGADRTPSRDAAAHGHLYRQLPEVGGIVHARSPYAAAWAAAGQPIPCLLRATAEQFGEQVPLGDIPLDTPHALGPALVELLRRARAVLVRGLGPVTVGPDARSAVSAAVLLEEAARTASLARQLEVRA